MKGTWGNQWKKRKKKHDQLFCFVLRQCNLKLGERFLFKHFLFKKILTGISILRKFGKDLEG